MSRAFLDASWLPSGLDAQVTIRRYLLAQPLEVVLALTVVTGHLIVAVMARGERVSASWVMLVLIIGLELLLVLYRALRHNARAI